jgi:hypothetical protein
MTLWRLIATARRIQRLDETQLGEDNWRHKRKYDERMEKMMWPNRDTVGSLGEDGGLAVRHGFRGEALEVKLAN